MKKIHIALAVLATVTLFSCVQEKSFEQTPVGENTIAFVLQTGTSTRAEYNPVSNGINIPVGKTDNGRTLYLEETITDLSYVSPATRGTPIYTENVGQLYANNLNVHASVNAFNAVFECMDEELTYDHVKDDPSQGLGWRYMHRYDSDPWNGVTTPVDFYLSIPDNMTNVSMDATAPYANGKFKFAYTSPTTATAQQDIIFGVAMQLTKKDHNDALPNGYPVLFQHALTAVKFAIATDSDDTAVITNVAFTGLKNTGTCIVDPSATGTSPKVDWVTPDWADTDATNVISQDFASTEQATTYTDGLFPDSFTVNNNQATELNTATASKTFWLIPQSFEGSNAQLTITYKYNGSNTPITKVINLGEVFKTVTGTGNSQETTYVEWKAGELRTYTLKVDEVNLKIEDDVKIPNTAKADNAFATAYKDNVTITNTGNTDAFIRASIVGQWWNKNAPEKKPEIVFGFTDAVGHLDIVESWYEDQFVSEATGTHGVFEGLPGYKGDPSFKADEDDANFGWVLCDDDYYYYTKPVAPDGTTSALFDKYTVKTPPHHVTSGGKVWSYKDIYFTLEIATQAIAANNIDGTHKAWDVAWQEATGKKPAQKQ